MLTIPTITTFCVGPIQSAVFRSSSHQTFPVLKDKCLIAIANCAGSSKGISFSVLILSTQASEPDFKLVGKDWESQKRDAHIYPPTETRFPQRITDSDVDIAQRYFLDKHTSTVHFVALTVK